MENELPESLNRHIKSSHFKNLYENQLFVFFSEVCSTAPKRYGLHDAEITRLNCR